MDCIPERPLADVDYRCEGGKCVQHKSENSYENSATKNCRSKGGRIEIRRDERGDEYIVCTYGSLECDGWDYYSGDCCLRNSDCDYEMACISSECRRVNCVEDSECSIFCSRMFPNAICKSGICKCAALCEADSGCVYLGENYVCSGGECVYQESISCSSDADCPYDTCSQQAPYPRCEREKCTCSPECNSDAACAHINETYICSSGECIPMPGINETPWDCVNDEDCAAGEQCKEGRCILD